MAWCGIMAQYKDVGLGQGQALWHCLKERGEVRWREKGVDRERERDGRESTQTAPTAHRRVDPQSPEWAALPKS